MSFEPRSLPAPEAAALEVEVTIKSGTTAYGALPGQQSRPDDLVALEAQELGWDVLASLYPEEEDL